MKKRISIGAIFVIGFALLFAFGMRTEGKTMEKQEINSDIIKLPAPSYESATCIEQALLKRKSVREYSEQRLSLAEVSQLLWASQGITDKEGSRTSPSAGAIYPLAVYLVAGDVEGVPDGIYLYQPLTHDLKKVSAGDVRKDLCKACLRQTYIADGSAVIAFSAVYEKVTKKYGQRGIRYTHMEVGHASQNVYLQAVSLNLGTVAVGAFYDNEVKKILHLGEGEQALYLMPVGRLK